MPAPAKDFAFLSEDIRRQREIAQDALEEAKRIDSLLKGVEDPGLKAKLEKTKETLLQVARGLVVNATSTSTSALDFVTRLPVATER